MNILSFSHYNLRAARPMLEQLRAFYTEVVGLRLGDRPPFKSFGYWLYIGEQEVLHLSEAGDEEERSKDAINTFDHAAFNCRGRREFEAKLTRLGIPYRTAEVPLTKQVQLFFTDPAGNGVELNFASTDV